MPSAIRPFESDLNLTGVAQPATPTLAQVKLNLGLLSTDWDTYLGDVLLGVNALLTARTGIVGIGAATQATATDEFVTPACYAGTYRLQFFPNATIQSVVYQPPKPYGQAAPAPITLNANQFSLRSSELTVEHPTQTGGTLTAVYLVGAPYSGYLPLQIVRAVAKYFGDRGDATTTQDVATSAVEVLVQYATRASSLFVSG